MAERIAPEGGITKECHFHGVYFRGSPDALRAAGFDFGRTAGPSGRARSWATYQQFGTTYAARVYKWQKRTITLHIKREVLSAASKASGFRAFMRAALAPVEVAEPSELAPAVGPSTEESSVDEAGPALWGKWLSSGRGHLIPDSGLLWLLQGLLRDDDRAKSLGGYFIALLRERAAKRKAGRG
jgi:hypothetical protein